MVNTAVETQSVEPLHNPDRLQMNYTKLDSSDWWFVAAGIAVAIIVGRLSHNNFVTAGVIVVVLLALIRAPNGRVYYVIPKGLESAKIDYIKKGKVWEYKGEPSGAKTKGPKKGRKQRFPIPLEVWRVPLSVDDLELNYGVIYRPSANTDSFVIVGDGSSIVSLGIVEQRARLDDFANVIKRATYMPGYDVVFSLVFRRDPLDIYEMVARDSEWQHPEVFEDTPEVANPTPRQIRLRNVHKNVEDGWTQSVEYGEKVWMATVVTVRRDLALKRALKKGLEVSDISRLTINTVAQAIIGGYRQFGIANPRTLDVSGIHAFLRGARDVTTIGSYYRQQLEQPGESNNSHWPLRYMRAHRHYSDNDGTFITVLRVSSARPRIDDTYFRQLFSINVRDLSIALVSDAAVNKHDVVALDRLQLLEKELGSVRKGVLMQSSLSVQERAERLEDRQRSLYTAGINQRYSIYIAVRATSEEQVADRVKEVSDYCVSTLGLSVKMIKGSPFQFDAMWTATTGINML